MSSPQQRPANNESEAPGAAFVIKRSIAIGAAVGLLAGIVYLAFIDASPIEAVIYWRNFVLAGIAAGALLGVVIALCRRAKS